MALQSKIARLPKKVRDELNRRLDDGDLGPVILPWINAQPDVQRLMRDHFKGAQITDQNLSTWRETGFCEWQERQKEKEFLTIASEFSREAVHATGLKLTEGAAAIAAGAIMTRIEDTRRKMLAGQEADGELFELIDKLTSLRSGEIGRVHADIAVDKQKLAREKHGTDRERLALEREKFEIAAAKALIKTAQSKEVQKVVQGPGTHHEKIAALRSIMFPQRTTP